MSCFFFFKHQCEARGENVKFLIFSRKWDAYLIEFRETFTVGMNINIVFLIFSKNILINAHSFYNLNRSMQLLF